MSKAPRNTLDDVDLMQYLDGEADEASAAEIAAALPGEDEARLKLQSLAQMSETVRSSLELAADEAAPRLDAMWASIERRIQSNGVHAEVPQVEHDAAPGAVPAIALAPLKAVTGAMAGGRSEPAERTGRSKGRLAHGADGHAGGLWAGFVRWLDTYRSHIATGALTATAVAALVLALRPAPEVVPERVVERVIERVPERMNDRVPVMGTQVPQAPDRMVPVSTPPTVERLDVSEGSGSVFTIPGEGEEDVSTTVIWLELDDSDAEETL